MIFTVYYCVSRIIYGNLLSQLSGGLQLILKGEILTLVGFSLVVRDIVYIQLKSKSLSYVFTPSPNLPFPFANTSNQVLLLRQCFKL
jgi:hypothetical protein